MTVPAVPGAVLDHVAHAVPDWRVAWPRYAVELGAGWASGGPGPGFAPGQLRFANQARIEVLMPNNVEVNDFLQRFLDHSGPGPHHLTFKVPDIEAALTAARSAGFDPVGIDFTDPGWMEAFLHPKQATGVVVQLAQASEGWETPAPEDYPTERRLRPDGTPVPPASLVRVVHAVADLRSALHLFAGLLSGEMVDRGTVGGEEWVDLRWAGPLALRLTAPAGAGSSPGLTEWLGGRTGRVHHLDLVVEDPDTLAGARAAGPGDAGLSGPGTGPRWVIEPEDNLGLRLVAASL